MMVISGFEVVTSSKDKGGVDRQKAISRVYHVKDAASEFARLAKLANPKTEIYVREIWSAVPGSKSPYDT